MLASVLTNIDRAAELLRAGELVAIPTETVYGLGANALDERAVAKVFAAKERPAFDPLIIHQSSAERVLKFARNIPPQAAQLAAAFWPGPLTLVLKKRAIVPDIVSAGLDTVALRVPGHPLTQALLEQLDFPVAAPSANPFGFVSPTTASHVMDQLGEKIAAVLDGGPCRVGLESTIVGFPNGKPVVYRKGGLPVEDIMRELGCSVEVKEHSDSRPAAPGMLSKHYSPGCEIILFERGDGREPRGLGYQEALVRFGPGADHKFRSGEVHYFNLSPEGQLDEAAARLFTILRRLNEISVKRAYIQLVPEQGLGRAINDRLRRAAAR